MKKINFTLKWRFTLLTVIIMTVAGAVLVAAINYDVNRRMPKLAGDIIYEMGVTSSGAEGVQEITGRTEIIQSGEAILQNGENVPIPVDTEYITGAVSTTAASIYIVSIIAFIITVIIGAVITYFAVGRALKPVVELNENIKNINENNLDANLEVKGANDEIKELTISFNKMMAKLDNAFSSQKRFNSSVAHELKTPLAVIKTNIDVLESGSSKSVDDYEKTLAVVEKSVMKMNSMIETLLDLVRQENAPLDDSINISSLLYDVVDDLTVIAKKNHVSIETEIEDLENEIAGNEILLYRAFYNIIENSIIYNRADGEVKVSCKKEADDIKVVISDTGKGIEEDSLGKIFNAFYRCEGVNLNSANGLGLGLALARSAVLMHGGTIEAESKVGEGTQFAITLPVTVLR